MKGFLCRLIGHNWFAFPVYGSDGVTVDEAQRFCWRCDAIKVTGSLRRPAVTTGTNTTNANVVVTWKE
jgi:hypothetical protein